MPNNALIMFAIAQPLRQQFRNAIFSKSRWTQINPTISTPPNQCPTIATPLAKPPPKGRVHPPPKAGHKATASTTGQKQLGVFSTIVGNKYSQYY